MDRRPIVKPLPGIPTLLDATGHVRYLPADYYQRRRLLRAAKRGDGLAEARLFDTCHVWVYAP